MNTYLYGSPDFIITQCEHVLKLIASKHVQEFKRYHKLSKMSKTNKCKEKFNKWFGISTLEDMRTELKYFQNQKKKDILLIRSMALTAKKYYGNMFIDKKDYSRLSIEGVQHGWI